MTSPNRPHRSKKRKLMTASDIDEELQGVFDVSAESDTDISELSSENGEGMRSCHLKKSTATVRQ